MSGMFPQDPEHNTDSFFDDIDSQKISQPKTNYAEKGNYRNMLLKGLIWVVMFAIAVVAIIIVLKQSTKYRKEVVVVKDDSSSYAEAPSEEQDLQDDGTADDGFVFNNQSKNHYDKSKSGVSDSTNVSPQVEDQDSNNKSKAADSQDSASLYKHSSGAASSSNIKAEKPTYSSEGLSAKTTSNADTVEQTATEATEPAAPSAVTNTTPAVHHPVKDQRIRDIILHNKASNSRVQSQSSTAAVQPLSGVHLTAQEKSIAVWLVSIYSASSLDSATKYWKHLKDVKSVVFRNKNVYIMKTVVPGKGTMFRVTLGETLGNPNKLASFSNRASAVNYCNYLKSNNVPCFIIKKTQGEIANTKR